MRRLGMGQIFAGDQHNRLAQRRIEPSQIAGEPALPITDRARPVVLRDCSTLRGRRGSGSARCADDDDRGRIERDAVSQW